MTLLLVLKYLWALPTTMVGLLAAGASLISGGRPRIVRGVIEIHGGLAAVFLRFAPFVRGGASAITLGHVVLGRDAMALELSRDHERVHVEQCERWGPLFIPAYLIASLIAALRGRNPYLDNPFEREAYDRTGPRIGGRSVRRDA